MEEKVKEIMSLIFNVDIEDITEDSSPDNLENWDSLRHMNFVNALEEEFDIELTDEQVTEMMNFKLVLAVLKEISPSSA